MSVRGSVRGRLILVLMAGTALVWLSASIATLIGADHEMWKPQLASFPTAGYFVIVPDLRGHGASDLPQTFRIADCARDESG